MLPDATILSILDRYKHNQPLSIEEKAVFHFWLINSLRTDKGLLKQQRPIDVMQGSHHDIIGQTHIGSINRKRKKYTDGILKHLRSITSGFFRIFASCPPLKK